MTDDGDRKSNGHAFDDSEWDAHEHHRNEIRALDRRLGIIDTHLNDRLDMIGDKLDRLLGVAQSTRSDIADLSQRWIRLVDRQIDLEKRLAALETRPQRKQRK